MFLNRPVLWTYHPTFLNRNERSKQLFSKSINTIRDLLSNNIWCMFVNNPYISFKTAWKIHFFELYWPYKVFILCLRPTLFILFPVKKFTPFCPILNQNRERIKEKNPNKSNKDLVFHRVFFLSDKDPTKSEFREKMTELFRIYPF